MDRLDRQVYVFCSDPVLHDIIVYTAPFTFRYIHIILLDRIIAMYDDYSGRHSRTPVNMDDIPIMCVRAAVVRSRVALERVDPLDHLNVSRAGCHPVGTGDPVLGTGMAEAHPNRRQLGHQIIGMRRPEDAALVRDELGQRVISDAGTAVCVLLVSSPPTYAKGGIPGQWRIRLSASPSPPTSPAQRLDCVP